MFTYIVTSLFWPPSTWLTFGNLLWLMFSLFFVLFFFYLLWCDWPKIGCCVLNSWIKETTNRYCCSLFLYSSCISILQNENQWHKIYVSHYLNEVYQLQCSWWKITCQQTKIKIYFKDFDVKIYLINRFYFKQEDHYIWIQTS